MTSNSDLIRYFQNVKQIYLRGILTRKLYDPFIFLTPYWENHFQVMKIKLSLLKIKLSYLEIFQKEVLWNYTPSPVLILVLYLILYLPPVKFQGKKVSYQGLVFFLPVVVHKIPDLGTKSTSIGIQIKNHSWMIIS